MARFLTPGLGVYNACGVHLFYGPLPVGSLRVAKFARTSASVEANQLALAHLAAGLARQLVDELDTARALVVRQVAAGRGDDVGGAGALTGPQLDDREHAFAHLRVGDADDGDVGDLRLLHQHTLDLRRIHVGPAGDDQVGPPISDE